MDDKRFKTEYSSEPAASTYQTGSTKPPRSYWGIILVLLGLVIFLCGIITALGLTNLQMSQRLMDLQETETNAVNFACAEGQPVAEDSQPTGLGFSGKAVSKFWHTYEELPLGIFIQSVDPATDAARQGIRAGDILTHCNGQAVDSPEALRELLTANPTAETITVVLYRDEKTVTLRLQVPAAP